MPTKPPDWILDRDIARVLAKDYAPRWVPLLDELVNFGAALYARSKGNRSDMLTPEGAPLLIFLHILEMTDGVSELVKQGCTAAAAPDVRAIFESALGLEYMLAKDTEARARAWLVGYASDELEMFDQIEGVGKAGQDFQNALKDDTLAGLLDVKPLGRYAKAQRPAIEALLAQPEHLPIVAARSALKKRKPNWYSVFGGPSDLRQLSKQLKREAQYLVLYAYLSSIQHGQNTRRFLSSAAAAEKTPLAKLLRDPSALPTVAGLAATHSLRAIFLILNYYRRGEVYERWYKEEIRPLLVPAETGA